MFFDKIRTHHLERKAILYIWQSFLIRFCIPGEYELDLLRQRSLAARYEKAPLRRTLRQCASGLH